jgi:quinoprotein glucose dehydrogenase
MKLYPYLVVIFFLSCTQKEPLTDYKSWSNYGGTKEMIRYSSSTIIDTTNVSKLKLAWEYESGMIDTANGSQIQCNPIVVDGILYGVNPNMQLFAIDATTGKEKWKFDASTDTEYDGNKFSFHIMINSRGVAYWSDGKDDKRIFFTAGSNTFAVNALTGKSITSFGNKGSVDLHEGLDRDSIQDLFVVNTSPGVVYKDLLILGTRVNEELPSAPGHIRAYDVKTGIRKWIFHTIPHPGEYGYDSWENKDAWKIFGGANVWSGFSLDEKRGMIFCGTGSSAYDFYGGSRKGNNLFANCVLALDAASGKRIWHQQVMHHDLWDKDLPTPPALVTINKDGKKIDAVAQPTKNGLLFLFERETGKPLFEIKETAVDTKSELVDEQPSPTQPIPNKPAPFSRQTLTQDDINPYVSTEEQQEIKGRMSKMRYGNPFVLPGKTQSLIFPGYDGGAEWGGPAYDPTSNIMYINTNEMAWVMEMLDRAPKVPEPRESKYIDAGKKIFIKNCASCHGEDRKGMGNNPSILGITNRYNKESFLHLVNYGRRMMPGFKRLSAQDKDALATYILDIKEDHNKIHIRQENKQYEEISKLMPYKMKGYNKFLTKEGLPAISPPWGTLNAIDLAKGEILWKIPFGDHPLLKSKGIKNTGAENYGGPVVTAGGLLFIAAAQDGKMRAYNKYTGKLLWEYQLPSPGFATPAVYEINGKQYIVIACGGGKLGTKSSDKYLAFSL